ncbi:MAG: hypothetical protein ACK5Q5_10050, partial [Planctomycetaceae bacterium]
AASREVIQTLITREAERSSAAACAILRTPEPPQGWHGYYPVALRRLLPPKTTATGFESRRSRLAREDTLSTGRF